MVHICSRFWALHGFNVRSKALEIKKILHINQMAWTAAPTPKSYRYFSFMVFLASSLLSSQSIQFGRSIPCVGQGRICLHDYEINYATSFCITVLMDGSSFPPLFLVRVCKIYLIVYSLTFLNRYCTAKKFLCLYMHKVVFYIYFCNLNLPENALTDMEVYHYSC